MACVQHNIISRLLITGINNLLFMEKENGFTQNQFGSLWTLNHIEYPQLQSTKSYKSTQILVFSNSQYLANPKGMLVIFKNNNMPCLLNNEIRNAYIIWIISWSPKVPPSCNLESATWKYFKQTYKYIRRTRSTN